MNINLSKTLNGSYLKTYLVFAGCLSALSIFGMVLLGIFAYEKNTWSYGIIVLLFLSLIMAILAIISMVAFYREKGRYHERITPIEKAELLDKINTFNATNGKLKQVLQTLKEAKTENKTLKAKHEKLNNEHDALKGKYQALQDLFGKEWEDSFKETKIKLVKDYCKRIDEAFEAAKTNSEKDLEGKLNEIITGIIGLLGNMTPKDAPKEESSIPDEPKPDEKPENKKT